ncbi:unnamed protein product [Urochloa humidicola]
MAGKKPLVLTILLLFVLNAGVCPAAQASRSQMANASVSIRAISSPDSGKSVFTYEKPFFQGPPFFRPPRMPPNSCASKAC